jgi:hypothetical protein
MSKAPEDAVVFRQGFLDADASGAPVEVTLASVVGQ